MIKIFHFITDTNVGGAGNLLCNQIKNMKDDELDITVVLPRGSMLKERIEGLPCHIIEASCGADRSFSVDGVIEDYKILKENRPDIVHSHASLSSRIAATALSIPTRIHTRHCVFPLSPMLKNPLGKTVCGAANNILSTKMIAVAQSAKDNLVDMGCNEKKIETVINGSEPIRRIDRREREALLSRLSLNSDNFIISIFARLEEYKGHQTFLDAAKICKKYCPDMRFLIVGDGSKKDELIRYSKENGTDDVVRFCGFAKDVSPYFNITDINVNCSYGTETSSLALSEGMSLGIPSVVSDYGGNTYMVKNGQEGLVFPAKNAESLAICLTRLYRDKELYEAMSRRALLRYETELTAKAMSDKMKRIYLDEYKKRGRK